jgi:hypothetical protein
VQEGTLGSIYPRVPPVAVSGRLLRDILPGGFYNFTPRILHRVPRSKMHAYRRRSIQRISVGCHLCHRHNAALLGFFARLTQTCAVQEVVWRTLTDLASHQTLHSARRNYMVLITRLCDAWTRDNWLNDWGTGVRWSEKRLEYTLGDQGIGVWYSAAGGARHLGSPQSPDCLLGHSTSYPIDIGVKRPGLEGHHDLNLVLRMCGVIPPLFYGVVLN